MQNKLRVSKLIDYHISFEGDELSLRTYENEDDGFVFFSFETRDYSMHLQGADNEERNILEFFEKICVDDKALDKVYDYLNGAFQLYIWDKKKNVLQCVCDYFGLGSSLYVQKSENQVVFFANYLHFKELNAELKVSLEALKAQFGFGYHVEPFRYLYENIKPMIGRKIYSFSSEGLNERACHLELYENQHELFPSAFKEGLNSTYYKNNYFLGLTSGKDSLSILSSIDKNKVKQAGTFGLSRSADVIQGESLAKKTGLDFKKICLCDENEFEEYAIVIANASGGLATCSYVDMMKFVDQAVPKNYAYLIGEGGGALKSFFKASHNNALKAMDEFITPLNFLQRSFSAKAREGLNGYPEVLISTVVQSYQDENLKKTFLSFYRFGRMAGNFSNRYKILGTYRDKCMPFLGARALKTSCNVDLRLYEKNVLHRKIIKENAPELLEYFDKPLVSSRKVQDWHTRIQGAIGQKLYVLLEGNLDRLANVFDKKGVLALAREELKTPGRGVYFLFRVLSLALFIKTQKIESVELVA